MYITLQIQHTYHPLSFILDIENLPGTYVPAGTDINGFREEFQYEEKNHYYP